VDLVLGQLRRLQVRMNRWLHISSCVKEQAQATSLAIGDKTDTPRFLVPLYRGIGDIFLVGLSAVDQIIKNDPVAYGKIDILCSPLQSEAFEYDPRINRVILTDKSLAMGPLVTEWSRGNILDDETARIMHYLQDRHYEAVLPTLVAPGLYFRLHARLMYPDLFKLGKNFLTRGAPSDTTVRKMIRQMVNRYFKRDLPSSILTDEVSLYMDTKNVQKATELMQQLKKRSKVGAGKAEVLLVATDSASMVTRPPTYLLAAALAEVLRRYHHLVVCILPSYTDTGASERLRSALASDFVERVFMLPAEPRLPLLDTAALIDQADIFVTGDTGVMHLAAATKRIRRGATTPPFVPRNSVKIIAIFGGTNPDIFGYSERTVIVGRGRKEQRRFSPGYVKELYNPRGKDIFDHISPQQLAEAISNQVSSPTNGS
jgi:ADP-heptose:LPS heptosyltransferase